MAIPAYSTLNPRQKALALKKWHAQKDAAPGLPGGGGAPTTTAPPYDPLAPLTPKQISSQAKTQAQAQVQPALDENTSEVGTANAASTTRQNQLQGWYGWGTDHLKDAFTRAQTAANNLIAAQNGGTLDEQNSLAAALAGQSDNTNRLAQQVGGQAPAPQDAQILAAAQQASQAANAGAAQTDTALTLGQGEQEGNLAVGGVQAGRGEQARLQAVLDQLTSDRKGITDRLPDLISTAQSGIESNEVNKAQSRGQLKLAQQQLGESRANRLFQQYLAQQKLNLDTKQETFNEWLSKQNLSLEQQKFSHQSAIDWANVGINRQQVNNQLKQIEANAKTAKGAAAKEAAKLRADQWNTGLQLLSGYMAPSATEGPPGVQVLDAKGQPVLGADGKPLYGKVTQNYQPRQYDEALRILTGQAGLSTSDALRILRASDNPDWRNHATYAMNRMKRRKAGKSDLGPWRSTLTADSPQSGGYVMKNGQWVKVG